MHAFRGLFDNLQEFTEIKCMRNPNVRDISSCKSRKIKLFVPMFRIYNFLTFCCICFSLLLTILFINDYSQMSDKFTKYSLTLPIFKEKFYSQIFMVGK